MSKSPFKEVQEPEIHTLRRVEVLNKHPEIKALMGYDNWSGLLTILLVVVQLFFAYYVGSHWFSWEYWWCFLLASYAVGGVMNHWVGMAIHEASHDLLAPKTSHNYWISIIANIPILLPVAVSFRRHHLKHHSHLGIEHIDNDFPSHCEANTVHNKPFYKIIWLSFYVFFLTLARGFVVKPSRWEWINIAVIVVADVLIGYYLGTGAVLYLLLSTFFGYSLHPVAGHFIHEHFIFKEGQETNSYYGILNWFCFNVGYHNEHHDFMNIPGRFLPRYHEQTKAFYEDLEATKSWTWMYVEFIRSRRVGAKSRYRRTDQVRQQGIAKARAMRQDFNADS
jgi:sphingolipid delta-4 desaturase